MLKQEMKGMAMIVMTQMTEFVQKYIVLQDPRQTHDIEVQIDVIASGTTPPIGGIMFDCHPVIREAIPCSQLGKTSRQLCLGILSQLFDHLLRSHRHILEFLLLAGNCLNYPGDVNSSTKTTHR